MSIRFGEFTLDTTNRLLRRGNIVVEVQPKVFDCILLLASRAGELVSLAALHQALWKDVSVGPDALRRVIREARKALGDAGDEQATIRTRKGVGYVFVAPVERVESAVQTPSSRAPAWPFVGRDRELAILTDALAAARGTGVFCLVSGEAGGGKSRLLHELRSRLLPRGLVWWIGRCPPRHHGKSFSAFRDIAGQISREPAVREHIERSPKLGAAAREWLDPASHFGPAPRAGDHADTEQRYLSCVALSDAVAEASHVAPVAVVVEDVHWADEGSVLLLEILARATHSHPIRLLSTYRPAEVSPDSLLGGLIARTSGRDGVVSIDAGTLSLAEIQRLQAATQHGAGSFSAEALLRLTGGNPLFLRQILEHGAIDGKQGTLPPSLRLVVGSRAARLPERTRELLRRAAVLGNEFTSPLLAAMAWTEPHDVLQHLEPAVAEGIVERRRHASARLGFCHALVRDALYDEIPGPERVRNHREALLAWEKVGEDPDRTAALASHAFLAGDAVTADRVRELCERAGREAFRELAFDGAALHLERALSLWPEAPSTASLELALLHARARLQADHAPALVASAFSEAAEQARAVDAWPAFAEAALGAAVGEDSPIELAFAAARKAETLLLEEALARLGDDDGPLASRLPRVLAWLHSASGHHDRALAAADVALRRTPPRADAFAQELHLGLSCMRALWLSDRPQAAATFYDLTQGCLAFTGAPRQGVELGIQAMTLALCLGDLPSYATLAEQVERWVERLPPPPRCGRLGVRLSLCQLVPHIAAITVATARGDFAAAERALTNAMDRIARLDLPPAPGGDAGAGFLFPLFAYQGRAATLEPLLDMAPAEPGDPLPLAMKAHCALERGDSGTAERHLATLRELGFRRTSAGRGPQPTPLALVTMADVCASIGTDEDAATLHSLIVPHSAYCAVEGIALTLGAHARPLGELAIRMGRHDLAERHFLDALVLNHHHEPERLRTQLGLARTLADTGRRREALELAGRARVEAAAMGVPRVVEAARRLGA